MFAHLLRASDARYAIGAVVSWPIYGALYILSLIYESPALVSNTALKRLEAASQTGLASAHKHKFREDCNDTPARDRLG